MTGQFSIARFARAALLLAASALAGCDSSYLNTSTTFNNPSEANYSDFLEADSDVARTFERALVYLPGSARRGRLEDADIRAAIERDGPHPVVLFMHGCTGLGPVRALAALAEAGFLVIAPDSFARRYRPLQCDAKTRSGGFNLFVYDFRQTELGYALHRLRAARWADSRRFFLFGSSEGAVTAALYRGTEFRARVITQWTCHGRPRVQGIDAPLGEPVLAIVAESDSWYVNGPSEGHCGRFLAGRLFSDSRIIYGVDHGKTLDTPSVVESIVRFIGCEDRLAARGLPSHDPRRARLCN